MNFTINDFEGPLDLLLHFVKTAKMDIYQIDVKVIIDEYLKFINLTDKSDLDNASEYLVMAAELIHLKSRLLINEKITDEETEYEINSEEDLKNKLIEYEKYKNICNEFRIYEENRKDFFTKVPENLKEYAVENNNTLEVSLDDLVSAFLDLKKRESDQKPINTRITKKELSVEDKVKYIKTVIKKGTKVNFFDLFERNTTEELIVTFLSILNLCKDNIIDITQDKNLGNIYIEGK